MTAGTSPTAIKPDPISYLREESIYELLSHAKRDLCDWIAVVDE